MQPLPDIVELETELAFHRLRALSDHLPGSAAQRRLQLLQMVLVLIRRLLEYGDRVTDRVEVHTTTSQ